MARARAKRTKREKLIGDTPREKRAARKLAKQQCDAERRRLKTWAPAERQRIAGVIHSMGAELAQSISTLRAQHAERVKQERAALVERIKTARYNARQGVCVDMIAGPIVRRFGPKAPPDLRRGGQTRMFSSAPRSTGGKLGAPFRVRGELFANEKAAHAALLRHLKADQGGILVLEEYDGAGGYRDGLYFGLQPGEGRKAPTLIELDPLDPRGHNVGRAAKLIKTPAERKQERQADAERTARNAFPSKPPAKRSSRPPAKRSSRPPAKRSSKPPRTALADAMARGAGWRADLNMEKERKRRAAKSRVPGAGTPQQYAGEIDPAYSHAGRNAYDRASTVPPAPKKKSLAPSPVGQTAAPRGSSAPPSSSDPRPSWGHEWGALGFKVKWARADELIKSGGLYGEEGRPYWSVQWSPNEGHQFRHGQYGWQLRERAGKVQLHVKPHDYWSTIGDAATLTFHDLYAGCVKRYYLNGKELRKLEGESKPKRAPRATLPTTRIPQHGRAPTETEVMAGARRPSSRPPKAADLNVKSAAGKGAIVRELGNVKIHGEPRLGVLQWSGGHGTYSRNGNSADIVQSKWNSQTHLRMSEWRSGRSYELGALDGVLTASELLKRCYIVTENDRNFRPDDKVPPLLVDLKKSATIGDVRDPHSESITWDGKYQEGSFQPKSFSGPKRPREVLSVEWFGDLPLVALWTEGKSHGSTRYAGDARAMTLPGLLSRCRAIVANGHGMADAHELYEASKHLKRR